MKALLRIVLLILIVDPGYVLAQQLPRYSQYIMNEFLINPSLAGFDGRTSLNLTARKEWVGFVKNTPETYSFSAQTRVLKTKFSVHRGVFGENEFKSGSKGRVGLGINIYNDNNAAIHQTGLQFTYAYHIFILNSQLSFGISGSAFQYRISKENAQLKNPEEDPLYGLIGKSTIIPDASFGVNYMTQKYHIGFSIAQMFQSRIKFGSNADFASSNDIRLKRHFYFIGSYRNMFIRNNSWEYEPSFIMRTNQKLNMLADLSIKFIYKREYWFGLSYRTAGDAIVMGGLKINKLYFGYSFDYGFNGITRYTRGSHEFTLSAKFGDTARRYRWLQRY